MKIRLQKAIAQAGVTSRRKAEDLIIRKHIKVNGKVAVLGQTVSPDDIITIRGKKLIQEDLEYYVLNKPKDTISTVTDQFNRKVVTSLIKSKSRIFPVGRLDRDTTGVLLITNDGNLAYKLTHPKFEINKTYIATLNEGLTPSQLKEINKPLKLEEGTSHQNVIPKGKTQYQVTIHQGWNHHVKKIFAIFNCKVIALDRISFAGIKYDNLSRGEYRSLTKIEINSLLS